MDCRNFKEMLDSYLCQELAVETNHTMLSHAEHCSSCRGEMASRRNLRSALQRACAQDRMSEEACQRLRAMLCAEAGVKNTNQVKNAVRNWRERWAKAFEFRFAFPAAATVVILALGSMGVMTYLRGAASRAAALQLSTALMEEAAADHRMCVQYAGHGNAPYHMPEEVQEFDTACLDLEKIAAPGAEGMQLCSAHVCGEDRRFAHLIYEREGKLISLLVTTRDGRAMKIGQLPSFDPALAGWQDAHQDGLELDACQTAKRVVLVVSGLNRVENERLAHTLAMPVVAHLRRIESQTASLNWPSSELPTVRLPAVDLTANLRGGELR